MSVNESDTNPPGPAITTPVRVYTAEKNDDDGEPDGGLMASIQRRTTARTSAPGSTQVAPPASEYPENEHPTKP
jgi:hypothetical protein